MGNWDEIVRTGAWKVGSAPPMALGVEAAGTISAVGDNVDGWRVGDEVMTHPLPLRHQGTWAKQLIAPAALLARKPDTIDWTQAAVFPVPALTAEQVLSEALQLRAGDRLLVHGAGSSTGAIIVALAVQHDAEVIATAGPASAERVNALGAHLVLDYHDDSWPEKVLQRTNGKGVTAAANAAQNGELSALAALADGGRLATITGSPPEAQRGITISNVYVRPDGQQLTQLAALLRDGKLTISVGASFDLDQTPQALAAAIAGGNGGAVVLTP